jgi:hypothetical protein
MSATIVISNEDILSRAVQASAKKRKSLINEGQVPVLKMYTSDDILSNAVCASAKKSRNISDYEVCAQTVSK